MTHKNTQQEKIHLLMEQIYKTRINSISLINTVGI